MKTNNNKKIVVLMVAVSAAIISMVLGHGCSISSYSEKTLTSISLTPSDSTIAAGTVLQLKATGHYSDQSTAPLLSSSLTWTTDPSVATISQTGLASAVATNGTCTITAVQAGITATTTLTIMDLPLQSITVTPGSPTVNKGLTQQFTASGLFSDGSHTIPSEDITTLVSWSSTTTSVATIGASSGLLNAVDEGTTDITASMSAITSDPVTVTVSNVALQSIAITGPKVTVGGGPYQFTATGTFVDSSTRDMTSQVVWSSLNTDIATVDSSGLVTAVAMGHATINAAAGAITGTLTVTVYPAGSPH
jgi:uncharacterized protein YjdB